MKGIVIAAFIVLASFTGVSAQWFYEDIPPTVVSSFENQFPDVPPDKVDWDWETEGYEANFYQNGKKHKGYFDHHGNFKALETQDINKDEIPSDLTDALKYSSYGDWDIDQINRLNVREDTFYEVDVKKGRHDEKLFYSKNGIRIDHDIYEKGQM